MAVDTDKEDTKLQDETVPVTVEFSGGLELLFSNEKNHSLSIPTRIGDGSPPNIAWLITYLCENLMKDPRKEMFVLDDNVRPGVLVLINEADWSLEGESLYEIQPKDHIMFISTLHGG